MARWLWTTCGWGRRAEARGVGRCAIVAALVLGVVLAPAALMQGCSRAAPSGGPLVVTRTVGEVGTAPGQFSYPRCLDSDGKTLWVIDKLARVQRLDPETGDSLGGWRMPQWQIGKPAGVTAWRAAGASDADVLVFVADTHYHRVMIYRAGPIDENGDDENSPTGELVGQFGSFGAGPGQFIYTTKVAILPSADGSRIERLYVGEYGGNDRIGIWEPKTPGGLDFEFKRTFGAFGGGREKEPLQFNRPQSLVVDVARRELIVSDACNHRVGRLTLEGELIAWYGGGASGQDPGQGPGEFNYPYGVTILDDGSLMVVEFGNSRVQRIDLATGKSLGIMGQRGRLKGELATPWASAVVGETLFVLDSGNNRIVGFDVPRGSRMLATEEVRTGDTPQ